MTATAGFRAEHLPQPQCPPAVGGGAGRGNLPGQAPLEASRQAPLTAAGEASRPGYARPSVLTALLGRATTVLPASRGKPEVREVH